MNAIDPTSRPDVVSPPRDHDAGPVRLAVHNDYEIVIAGLVGVLQRYQDRVVVVEAGVSERPPESADVVLFDTFGRLGEIGYKIVQRIRTRPDQKVAVFTAATEPDAVIEALAGHIDGYLHKSVGGEELVRALERINRGERVVLVPAPDEPETLAEGLAWPGQAEGLSEREAEVLALICQGLSNEEVAKRAYLSINTIKSYIRSAYRKMGVSSRSQAVVWGLGHGLDAHPAAVAARDVGPR